MGRIGTLPSVPEELVGEVLATSWSIADTNRDPTLVVRARPGQLATACPSCRGRLLIDVVGELGEATPPNPRMLRPPSAAIRYATSVAEKTPLFVAAELLTWAPRRTLVVVDSEQRPLGVVTAAHVLSTVKGRSAQELAEVTVLDAATSGGPLLPNSSTLEAAARLLVREDRDFLIVVDEAGKLMGALLSTDILTSL